MTGLFARFRAWLGGLFDGGTTADDETEAAASADEASPRVVHRDDRPLETPSTMERPDPPSAESESPGSAASAPAPDEPTVSIPDAEATAGASEPGSVAPPTDGTTAGDEGVERAEAATEAGAHPDAESVDARDADGAVACSVCGTTVEDPSEPCPLCRSTDVVPVADADAEDAEPFTRGGRTAVSTADDEAVDRLRDVRKGE
ncbi:hypothetical protein [Haloplanus rubicundus]|uniref:Uncharacterized protein n=1 Tax=Haloplanus rubicundus TaxID=1547898 RepID=A0A345EDR1_9EURY|nr:hypothetical protein [Haloplanus rubicundus]AXG10333.1 hypothetical protein DU484_11025 [Haloplanus rubicundus]